MASEADRVAAEKKRDAEIAEIKEQNRLLREALAASIKTSEELKKAVLDTKSAVDSIPAKVVKAPVASKKRVKRPVESEESETELDSDVEAKEAKKKAMKKKEKSAMPKRQKMSDEERQKKKEDRKAKNREHHAQQRLLVAEFVSWVQGELVKSDGLATMDTILRMVKEQNPVLGLSEEIMRKSINQAVLEGKLVSPRPKLMVFWQNKIFYTDVYRPPASMPLKNPLTVFSSTSENKEHYTSVLTRMKAKANCKDPMSFKSLAESYQPLVTLSPRDIFFLLEELCNNFPRNLELFYEVHQWSFKWHEPIPLPLPLPPAAPVSLLNEMPMEMPLPNSSAVPHLNVVARDGAQ